MANERTLPAQPIRARTTETLDQVHRRIDGAISRDQGYGAAGREALRRDAERLAASCRQTIARRRARLSAGAAVGDPGMAALANQLRQRRANALALRVEL